MIVSLSNSSFYEDKIYFSPKWGNYSPNYLYSNGSEYSSYSCSPENDYLSDSEDLSKNNNLTDLDFGKTPETLSEYYQEELNNNYEESDEELLFDYQINDDDLLLSESQPIQTRNRSLSCNSILNNIIKKPINYEVDFPPL